MALANTSSPPPSPARTSIPVRDHVADADDSLSRKKQRVSEESDPVIESVSLEEDVGLSYASAITIHDDPDPDAMDETLPYSEAFRVDSRTSPIRHMDFLATCANSNNYLQVEHLYNFSNSLGKHLKTTANDDYDTRQGYYLADENFFHCLAVFAVRLLNADDLLEPGTYDEDEALIAFRDVYLNLAHLCARIIPLLPVQLDGALARRDSIQPVPTSEQRVPLLYYLTVLETLTNECVSLTSYLGNECGFDVDSVLGKIVHRIILRSGDMIDSLNSILRVLSARPREFTESWDGIAASIAIACMSMREAPQEFHTGTGADQIETTIMIVNDSIIQPITQKHPRALPLGFHDAVVGQIGNLVLTTTPHRDLTSALRLYKKCIQSPDDALLPGSGDADATEADLQSVCGSDRSVLAELLKHVWVLRVLKGYIATDIMNIRSRGIIILRSLLDASYNRHKQKSNAAEHPALQHLARFLRAAKFTEYIFSVDSHASLVMDYGRVVAFLIYTGTYTDQDTDLIWRACTTSVEDEFVRAAFEVLSEAKISLGLQDLLYLASRYVETPVTSIGVNATNFLKSLFQKINTTRDANTARDAWDDRSSDLHPTRICLGILKQIDLTGPSAHSDALSGFVFLELSMLFKSESKGDDRRMVYEMCITEIRSRTVHATTCLRILSTFSKKVASFDEAQLILDMMPVKAAVDELCTFVCEQASLRGKQTPGVVIAVNARFDFCLRLIGLSTDSLDPDLERRIWSHSIGDDALDNKCRELAFDKLINMPGEAKEPGTIAGFLGRCIEEYLPTMSADFATPRLVTFLTDEIKKSFTYLPAHGFDTMLDNSFWKELVRIATTAKTEVVASCAMKSIRDLLLEYPKSLAWSSESLGRCHAMFVRRLVAFFQDSAHPEDERRRAIVLLDSLVLQGKEQRHKTINKGTTTVDLTSDGQGDQLSFFVHFRAPDGVTKVLNVRARSDQRLSSLSMPLQSMTGVPQSDLVLGGNLLAVTAMSDQSVEDACIVPDMTVSVRPRYTFGCDFSLLFPAANELEQEIMAQWKHLEGLLDGSDGIAVPVFNLLAKVGIPDDVRRRVAAPDAIAAEVFPPSLCKTLLSLHVLLVHLCDCNRVGVADKDFILQGARLISGLLMDTGRPFSPDLMTKAIPGLTHFLQEHPRLSPPPPYFAEPKDLAFRLLEILGLVLDMPISSRPPTQALPMPRTFLMKATYTALLQIVRVETGVWSTIAPSQEFAAVHRRLFLDNDRDIIIQTAKLVSSYCVECRGEVPGGYLSLLIDFVPDVLLHGAVAQPYFDLLRDIVPMSKKLLADEQHTRQLVAQVTARVWNHAHKETPSSAHLDVNFCGLLKLLLSSIDFLKSFKKPLSLTGLCKDIFSRLLFPDWDKRDSRFITDSETDTASHSTTNPEEDPMAEGGSPAGAYAGFRPLMHFTSRAICLEIVRKTFETLPCYQFLVVRSMEAMRLTVRNGGGKFIFKDWLREPTACAGLTNLGMTCYMNSLLQQIYGNLKLRNFLFNTPIVDMERQGLLLKVRTLFAQLQEEDNPCIETTDLAGYLRIAPDAQEDVHGFYTVFIGALEQCMPDANTRTAFTQMFSGKLLTQIKGACGHVSSKLEPFSDLSITVQNKASLEDSLAEFVQGEPMQGANKYKCLSCDQESGGRLVEAMKRTCLEDVPDHLTVCLKRFTFDMHGHESKNNDLFDFPEEIDMARFKRDHLEHVKEPVKPDMFKLVGVIVHSGVLTFGHYWSYVLLRGSNPRWVRLEDAMFRQVSGGFAEMRNECLGGNNRSYGAYVLLYERQTSLAETCSMVVRPTCDPLWEPVLPPRVRLPLDLERNMTAKNEWRYRTAHIFNPQFEELHAHLIRQLPLHSVLRTSNTPEGSKAEDSSLPEDSSTGSNGGQIITQVAQMAAKSILHVVLPQWDAQQMKSLVVNLKTQMQARPQLAHDMITVLTVDDKAAFSEMFTHPDVECKAVIVELLDSCLKITREHEPDEYEGDFEKALAAHNQLTPSMDEYTQNGQWRWFLTFAFGLFRLGPAEAHRVLQSDYCTWAIEILSVVHSLPIRERHPIAFENIRKKFVDVECLYDFLVAILCNFDAADLRELSSCRKLPVAHMLTDLATTRDNYRILPWMLLALQRRTELPGRWQDYIPGQLVALLAGSGDAKCLQSVYASLLFCTRIADTHNPLVYTILHFCKAVGDGPEALQVMRDFATYNILNYDVAPELAFDCLAHTFPLVPIAVMHSMLGWVQGTLRPRGKPGRAHGRIVRLLKQFVFDPQPITDMQARPAGDDFDTNRIAFVRSLCRQLVGPLRRAYGDDAVDGWNSMIKVLAMSRDYFQRLRRDVTNLTPDTQDEDDDEVAVSRDFMAQYQESLRTLHEIGDLLELLRGWETASMMEQETYDEADGEDESGLSTEEDDVGGEPIDLT